MPIESRANFGKYSSTRWQPGHRTTSDTELKYQKPVRTCNSRVTETKEGLPRQVWLSLSHLPSSLGVSHLKFPQVNHASHPSPAWSHTNPELPQQNFRSILCQKNWVQHKVFWSDKVITQDSNWHFLPQNLPVLQARREIQQSSSPLGINFSLCSYFPPYREVFLPYRKEM